MINKNLDVVREEREYNNTSMGCEDKNKNNERTVAVDQMIVDNEYKEVKNYGVRHQQCLVLFCCLTTAYAMRSCMGVALVAMTSSTSTENYANQNFSDGKCYILPKYNAIKIVHINNDTNMKNDSLSIPYEAKNDTILKKLKGENSESIGILNYLMLKEPYPLCFWPKKTQDVILSSFQWGYMLLQIPAGQLAHRFGSRMLLTGALMINGVVSFIIPWAAYYGGWKSTVICRFLIGLSQACVLPGMHTLFGKWAPLEERARLAGFALGGQALGSVLGLPITGFLAASSLGWPGIFRFYGLLAVVVAVVMWYTIADSPDEHSKISELEKRYIEEGIGLKNKTGKHYAVPWSRILRTRGLYAIVIAHIGHTWGQLTLYTEIPSFMNKIMNVNIKANGVLTALPFLVMWFTNFFFSWMTDMLIVKKFLCVTNARKVANSLGSIPPTIGLVVLAFVPKNIYVVESILVIICAFKIAAHVGFQVNHIDISPNFAGTMMSLSNFVSNCIGSMAPMAAGYIVTDDTDEYQWRKVFFIAAGLYFFTNLVYLVFGTSEKADWNEPEENKPEVVEDKEEREVMIKSENGKHQ